jgi:hypothetical protein
MGLEVELIRYITFLILFKTSEIKTHTICRTIAWRLHTEYIRLNLQDVVYRVDDGICRRAQELEVALRLFGSE